MEYVITDGSRFIKQNNQGDPTKVNQVAMATIFETELDANSYLQSIKMKKLNTDSKIKFKAELIEGGLHNRAEKIEKEIIDTVTKEIQELDGVYEDFNNIKFSDNDNSHVYSGKTYLENEDFNLEEFLIQAIKVFSQLDLYGENMAYLEKEMDLNINDLRHFERDDKTRLNAVQMQNLGYCRQEMERMRKRYKTNKILAHIFIKDFNRIKNAKYIKVVDNIVNSEYRYRRLTREDIGEMIKTKSVSSGLKIVS